MNHITTTDLRTKSSELVDTLKSGVEVTLIHRSKIIGTIRSISQHSKKINAKALEKYLHEIKPDRAFSQKEKEQLYSTYLKERKG